VALAAVVAVHVCPPLANGFIEELFSQFGGGGGGGEQFQFQMGGDGQMFQMGGGGGQKRPKKPKFPKGVPNKVSKDMAWVKGTEWNWNNWRDVKFQKDGSFEAPTRDCQGGMCLWSAEKGKIYILWGEVGLHEGTIIGQMPTEQDPAQMKGLKLKGKRKDGQTFQAGFKRVFDFEAAEMDKDLYGMLGISDDSDEGEIKKVYRKLSIKYHPDKNPGEAGKKKFAEIRDAYEILNDPDKKILYDTGGMEAVKKHDKGEVQKGDDLSSSLDLSLDDLYNGAMRQANYDRRVVCRGCAERPDKPNCQGCSKCPNEVKTVNVQMGPFMTQQQQEVPSKEKCKQQQTSIDAHVEKGMRDGESLTFPRMAEQRPGMLPGAVVLSLKVRKHAKFTRKGDDLHMTMKISIREALLGWSQKIRHMDNHIVELSTESVTRPFQVFKVKAEGMPQKEDPATFGDLYVKVEVMFPTKTTDEQQKLIASVFDATPPRNEL
jgi:DnaJ-class molecular chaperone